MSSSLLDKTARKERGSIILLVNVTFECGKALQDTDGYMNFKMLILLYFGIKRAMAPKFANLPIDVYSSISSHLDSSSTANFETAIRQSHQRSKKELFDFVLNFAVIHGAKMMKYAHEDVPTFTLMFDINRNYRGSRSHELDVGLRSLLRSTFYAAMVEINRTYDESNKTLFVVLRIFHWNLFSGSESKKWGGYYDITGKNVSYTPLARMTRRK
jgi:hypothetical protein